MTGTDINGGAHNNDLERAEFEHWAEEAGALPWGSLKKRRIGDGYSAQIYNYMWHAWRARSQLEPV